MNYVIIDLEWNGTYVKKVHGFFNEIIEIGAVKLDANMREIDRFQAIIKPAVSKKLTKLVTDLTSITDEELTDGGTFTGAMAAIKRFLTGKLRPMGAVPGGYSVITRPFRITSS